MLLRLQTLESAILAAQKVQLFLALRFLPEEEFAPNFLPLFCRMYFGEGKDTHNRWVQFDVGMLLEQLKLELCFARGRHIVGLAFLAVDVEHVFFDGSHQALHDVGLALRP